MSNETVRTVLERAAADVRFYGRLAEDYDLALKGYDLAPEEAMRIGTGDLRWIESHIGAKVDQETVDKVFVPLLSREQWSPS